jgi:hypothetical protein
MKLDNGSIALKVSPRSDTISRSLMSGGITNLKLPSVSLITIKNRILIAEHWDPQSDLYMAVNVRP